MAQSNGLPQSVDIWGQGGYGLAESHCQAVHDIARSQAAETTVIAARIAERICSRDAELQRPEIAAIILKCCQADTAAALDYLARGVELTSVAPSKEAVHLMLELVRRGVSERVINRAYRTGFQVSLELWADLLAAHGPQDREMGWGLVKAGVSYLTGMYEVLDEQLSEERQAERERLAREQSLARIEEVRDVLTRNGVDIDSASVRLGYRISGGHRAFVVRVPVEVADAGAALDAAVKSITAAAGVGRGFRARVDMHTEWCWLPFTDAGLPLLPKPDPPVLVTIGGYGTGLTGFRRSHTEAVEAMRVAGSAAAPDPLTRYDEVDIAAMCSVDIERCRDFMRRELRGLVNGDPVTVRNRETVEAFFAANSSYRGAAAVLGIHHRTVRYRLEQVEAVLGRPVAERRLALELALHLLAKLGPDGPEGSPN
ncbi:PucR family transcriptional regulator [Streptomyces sp. RGM 3693]|uniref:PucR family transcriptional regulator n=1 Tax=Streptomyces sp. RGM 3693 TaxID=3413284 RepID=UPI003D2AA22A